MIRDLLFLTLFFVLLGAWATGWLAFNIAGGMIHFIAGLRRHIPDRASFSWKKGSLVNGVGA